jgi:hypothetical protein
VIVTRYNNQKRLVFPEIKGDKDGILPISNKGVNTIQIHRTSYLKPKKKEGAASIKESCAGLKHKNVISRSNVKAASKIKNN